MAQRALRKFVYNDTGFSGSTTSGGGYHSLYNFRGNSLYDPDSTGTGVQPYGYDETTPLFEQFRVIGSKITVYFRLSDNDPGCVKAALFAASAASGTLPTSDFADIAQKPGTQTRSVTNVDTSRRMKLTQYRTTRWVYPGITTQEEGFAHQKGANPGKPWYWYVVFDSWDAQQQREITFDVKIVYYAVCRTTFNSMIQES